MNTIQLSPLPEGTTATLQAEQLYLDAFPANERRDLVEWQYLRHNQHNFSILAAFAGNTFAGFITLWHLDACHYVEHFAIRPEQRGNGIGARILALVKEHVEQASPESAPKPLVLEVERPDTEMAHRRIRFYERNGFVLNTADYLQPPYRKGDEWLPLFLMSTDNTYLEKHLKEVVDSIYRHVYRIDKKL